MALLLAGALISPAGAQAEPAAAPALTPTSAAHDVPIAGGINGRAATALAEELGSSRTGGVYLDQDSDRLVIAVTDEAAASAVREAGGIAEHVTYSEAELEAVTTAFNESVSVPGTKWGTDIEANRVNVEADSTVSADDYAHLLRVAEPFGSAVRVSRFDGELRETISGGNYIEGNQWYECSLGFNVRDKSNPNSLFFLTAGHCTTKTAGTANWRDGNGTYIGYETGGYYPVNDFGLVRHYNANVSKPGNVWLHQDRTHQDITHSRDPFADEFVCSSGWVTGYICGYVLEKNVTANYGDGNIYGLFRWTNCNIPGDSGGAVFHGDAALGLISGNITWNDGCDSLAQPVNEALAWYGMEVY